MRKMLEKTLSSELKDDWMNEKNHITYSICSHIVMFVWNRNL